MPCPRKDTSLEPNRRPRPVSVGGWRELGLYPLLPRLSRRKNHRSIPLAYKPTQSLLKYFISTRDHFCFLRLISGAQQVSEPGRRPRPMWHAHNPKQSHAVTHLKPKSRARPHPLRCRRGASAQWSQKRSSSSGAQVHGCLSRWQVSQISPGAARTLQTRGRV